MTKPVIGINADFRRAQGNQPAFTYLASGYYDCIFAAGGIPMILPPMEEAAELFHGLYPGLRVNFQALEDGSDMPWNGPSLARSYLAASPVCEFEIGGFGHSTQW